MFQVCLREIALRRRQVEIPVKDIRVTDSEFDEPSIVGLFAMPSECEADLRKESLNDLADRIAAGLWGSFHNRLDGFPVSIDSLLAVQPRMGCTAYAFHDKSLGGRKGAIDVWFEKPKRLE